MHAESVSTGDGETAPPHFWRDVMRKHITAIVVGGFACKVPVPRAWRSSPRLVR